MSIRLRLTLWYGGVLALVLVVVGVLTWFQLGSSLREEASDAVQVQATDVTAGFDANSNVSVAERDPTRPSIFTIIYGPSGAVVRSTPGAPALPATPVEGSSEMVLPDHTYAVYADRAAGGSLIVAIQSLAEVDRAVDGLSRWLLVIAGGGAVAGLLVGWFLAGRALAPTGKLARQLSSIGVGELGRRIEPAVSGDEIGSLARAINSMLERIDDGVHRQRAFVTAASHDLRTPIAALRTELELAQARGVRAEELRAAIERAHGDAVRLGNLANDLLALAEAEPGGRNILRQRVSVDELVHECADDQSAVARSHGVVVNVDAPTTDVMVDRSRIEQAIRNLLTNAIRHSPRGATVEIHAAVVDGAAATRDTKTRARMLEVDVLDRGPGVPADVRPNLFLPFAARSGHEHSGLGLATAAAAVRAHGGVIRYADRPGGGAEFAFTVPA